MGGLFQGQLRSFRSQEPTTTMVPEALPTTIKVMLGGVGLAILVGVPLGVVAAYRPRSLIDNLLSLSMAFALSVPTFVLASILIRVFAEQLRWLPASGIRPPGAVEYSWQTALSYLVLPSIVTAFPISPILARYTRDALREVLQEDYVRTAASRRLTRQLVLWRHMLPNILVPLLSVLGVIIPLLLGGSVIVESLFALPGLGRVTVQAALQRDYPVVMTTTIVSTLLIVISNLATDMLYYVVDPRLRPR